MVVGQLPKPKRIQKWETGWESAINLQRNMHAITWDISE